MSSSGGNEVIEELQESIECLNSKINKMCLTLEGSCLKENAKSIDYLYERESDSDQTKPK